MVALRSSSNSSILMSSHSSDTTPYPNVELPSRIVNRIPLPTTCKEIFNMFISVSLIKDFQLLCIISSSFLFHITLSPYSTIIHVRSQTKSELYSMCLRWAHVGSARIFRYQHVGIGNTTCSRWGQNPTQSPNASGFALQWNIGFPLTPITPSLK